MDSNKVITALAVLRKLDSNPIVGKAKIQFNFPLATSKEGSGTG